MTTLRETRETCETSDASGGTSAIIRGLDAETESLKIFTFPPDKPAIASHRRVSRTGAQMAALLSDPQIRAAVFGPDIPE
jgi:hypothetical protein